MSKRRLTGAITLIAFLSLSVSAYSQEVFFSPNGGCTEKVIQEIGKAQSQIDVAIYSFTSKPIAEALARACEREVNIRILLDRQQAGGQYSRDEYLVENGLSVILDKHDGSMHNKICVIDKKVLITGSFNWSNNAEERNEENMLVFTDSPVVQLYQQRLEHLWEYNGGVTLTDPTTWGEVKVSR